MGYQFYDQNRGHYTESSSRPFIEVDREKRGVIVDVPYQQVKDALKVGGAIGTAIVAGLSFLNGKRQLFLVSQERCVDSF